MHVSDAYVSSVHVSDAHQNKYTSRYYKYKNCGTCDTSRDIEIQSRLIKYHKGTVYLRLRLGVRHQCGLIQG